MALELGTGVNRKVTHLFKIVCAVKQSIQLMSLNLLTALYFMSHKRLILSHISTSFHSHLTAKPK